MNVSDEILADLVALGVSMTERKAQYITAEACPDCGIVPLFAGHTCGDYWVREACPACGMLLTEYRSAECTHAGPRCDCGCCPFCAECCLRISTGKTGQLIPWPLERIS